jgi:hypothetical protein
MSRFSLSVDPRQSTAIHTRSTRNEKINPKPLELVTKTFYHNKFLHRSHADRNASRSHLHPMHQTIEGEGTPLQILNGLKNRRAGLTHQL